ncbi:MAG TPA: type II toxin-antitoxin system Phd/YefM family antitoxin [Clostridiales bacterium]|nr:type II toxin-antitoxin system Phd/YefM family antitoxin [Clostridiales bacterium]
MKVSATDMKNFFGKYLEKCKDEAVFITKNDRIVAKLIAYEDPSDGYLMLKDGSAAYAYSGKRITYEEFLKITENNEERYEYIDGEIYLMSSPGMTHQLILANLNDRLFNWFRGKKCRVFSAPFDVTLTNDELKSKNVVEPDLLISCDYQEQRDANDRYTGIPDLVIEILSPHTRSMDLVKKLNVYLSGGIGEYWVVDPRDRKVILFYFVEKQLEEMILFKCPDVVKSLHFAGLEVPTEDIFSE